MKKYIYKRILLLIPVLIGVSFLVFSIMSLTPGDPAQLILGENAPKEAIEQLREKMGLNSPFFVQYFIFIKNAVLGDFGISYSTGRPVFQEIFSRFPNTLLLTILGTVVALIIGIPLGILSAIRQYSFIDSISMIIALIGASMPTFWLGLMFILFFSVHLRWFPSEGFNSWKSVVLPTFTSGIIYAGVIARMTRSTMLEVIRQDYIRTAYAKGLKKSSIILKHALRNAMIPIVTIIGLHIGRLLGGAIIIETVYSWPGVGRLMIDSIRQKDTPVVLASVIFLAFAFSIVNLVVDILYVYVDPRMKLQYE